LVSYLYLLQSIEIGYFLQHWGRVNGHARNRENRSAHVATIGALEAT